MKPSIVVYTHTDYKHVWPLWFGQTKKYLNDFKKIIFVNKNDSDIPSDYQVVEYDDSLPYNLRVSSCLEKLDQNETIIFHHEDMFLYNEPKLDILNEFILLVNQNPETLIKLLRAGTGISQPFLHKNLFSNPPGLNYSIQPTLIKVELLHKIYSTNFGSSIWDFEKNAGGNMNTLYSYYCYNNENLRGLAHYDSNIYPYVATAIVKGEWNVQEYKNELMDLFKEYEINYI